MNNKTMTALSLALVFAHIPVMAEDPGIVRLDGHFGDWDRHAAVLAPADNDLVRSVRVTNGQSNVFIAVQLSREITIQKENSLTLLVDTDGDTSTGRRVGSLGADVQYNFGSLEAIRYIDGKPTTVPHAEIGIIWAPTFSADRYEISLPLALFDRRDKNDAIALAVAELQDLPGTATFVDHTASPASAVREISLQKLAKPYVRILTMNVLYDGLFKRPDTFERIFRALDPDIILLSEVYLHSADQVVALLDERFPAENAARRWYSFGRPGKVTVSRFPFLATDILLEDLYTLIDVPGFDGGLFVIHTHLECCDHDELREEKVDRILGALQSGREDEYSILYQYQDRPLIFSGDLNLVGKRRPYDTLVDGINADLSAANASDTPRKLEEAISYHTNTPFTFTWKDDTLIWPPGKLDFTFYTVPKVKVGKSFVLYTPNMDPSTLQEHGLRKSDSLDASDHLPHVVDVAPAKGAL